MPLLLPELPRRLREQPVRFAVTGASGWFGRVTLDILGELLPGNELGERVACYASAARDLILDDGRVLPLRPFDELPELDPPPTHLLHYAYLTRDRADALGVDRFVRDSAQLTQTILQVIATRPLEGFFFTSSGAAAGYGGASGHDVSANPYGSQKVLDELVFRQACRDAGTRIVIARVFAAAGRHMTRPELYALGNIIGQTRQGGPVRVQARRHVVRSYVGVEDVVKVALVRLLDDVAPPETLFDTGGEPLEIEELARRVIGALGREDVTVERVHGVTDPPDVYVGDGAAMDRLAALHGVSLTPLDELIRQTAAEL
jgi:UDP-glucuronate decarboxylase